MSLLKRSILASLVIVSCARNRGRNFQFGFQFGKLPVRLAGASAYNQNRTLILYTTLARRCEMKALKIGCGVVFAGLLLLFAIGLFVEKTIVSEQRKESAARAASPTRKWAINRSRSSFDDSPTVELQLEAETPISGWPAKVETPLLVLRC
jgi:hypothetical protein